MRAATALADRLRHASVLLPEMGCGGVVAHSQSEIVTAAHCIPSGRSAVTVRHLELGTRTATVLYRDDARDLAWLELSEPFAVSAFPLATGLPKVNDKLVFLGRIDRAKRPRRAVVERVARCPHLPELDDALFTTLDAKPGDSGAPLVNDQGEVVALVQGGARCHIASPVYPLVRARAAREASLSGPSSTPAERLGPFRVERTRDGYRLRWSFSWRLGG